MNQCLGKILPRKLVKDINIERPFQMGENPPDKESNIKFAFFGICWAEINIFLETDHSCQVPDIESKERDSIPPMLLMKATAEELSSFNNWQEQHVGWTKRLAKPTRQQVTPNNLYVLELPMPANDHSQTGHCKRLPSQLSWHLIQCKYQLPRSISEKTTIKFRKIVNIPV